MTQSRVSSPPTDGFHGTGADLGHVHTEVLFLLMYSSRRAKQRGNHPSLLLLNRFL